MFQARLLVERTGSGSHRQRNIKRSWLLYCGMELWRLILCCCLLPYFCITALTSCKDKLGNNNEDVSFSCTPSDRINATVVWMHNDREVANVEGKYVSTPTSLTVKNIIHSDEGNYSCMYFKSSSEKATLHAGCVLVYAKPSFTSSSDIEFANDGKIMFDLSVSFSQHGPSGNQQRISEYKLENSDKTVKVRCPLNTGCSFVGIDDNQWWTVEDSEPAGYVFVLHQAKSTDRGSYTATVTARHPDNRTSTDIMKTFHATAPTCNVNYPSIEDGTVLILESTEIDVRGAQANYSCNTDCVPDGSTSLRCKVGVLNGHSLSQWVNETGHPHLPHCFCPGNSFTTSRISTISVESSSVSISKDVTRVKHRQSTGLSGTNIAVIVVVVVVTTALLTAFLILLIVISLKKIRHQQQAIKKPDPQDLHDVAQPQDQDMDDSDSYKDPHEPSSVTDDNLSDIECTVDELTASFKNSQAGFI